MKIDDEKLRAYRLRRRLAIATIVIICALICVSVWPLVRDGNGWPMGMMVLCVVVAHAPLRRMLDKRTVGL